MENTPGNIFPFPHLNSMLYENPLNIIPCRCYYTTHIVSSVNALKYKNKKLFRSCTPVLAKNEKVSK